MPTVSEYGSKWLANASAAVDRFVENVQAAENPEKLRDQTDGVVDGRDISGDFFAAVAYQVAVNSDNFGQEVSPGDTVTLELDNGAEETIIVKDMETLYENGITEAAQGRWEEEWGASLERTVTNISL